jgi:glycosyltransferase involved in cell wall biosynthesis
VIRIAMIAHLSEVSGAGVALLDTAVHLDRSRFDPVLIVPAEGPLAVRARAAGMEPVIVANAEESMASAGLARRLALAGRRAGYVARLRAFLARGGYALAYVSSSTSVFAGMAARLARIPVVWHIHETVEQPGRATRLKLKWIERLSSGVLYASGSAEDAFPAAQVKRRLVVRNFVDVARFERADGGEAAREALGIPGGAAMVVSSGMFHRKAPDVFLQAAAMLCADPDCGARFVVLGAAAPGQEAFAADLHRRAAAPPLGGRVVFAGFRDDLPAVLKGADIFVSPSRNEALPIAITQAMAAGTPVIATDTGDCAALLEGGRLGLVVPREDAAALARAMRSALADAPGARARAALAQAAVRERYAGADFWKPIEDFLEDAALGR